MVEAKALLCRLWQFNALVGRMGRRLRNRQHDDERVSFGIFNGKDNGAGAVFRALFASNVSLAPP